MTRRLPKAVYRAYPSINQSRDKECNEHVPEEVYQMGAVSQGAQWSIPGFRADFL